MLAGVLMVRDEVDIIAGTIRHLADEVDLIVVADNGSVDGTREVLESLSVRVQVVVLDDPDPAYYQSRKVSALAELAATKYGATWICPADADEIWVHRGDRMTNELLASQADVITADLFNHFPSGVDPVGDDPFLTIQWRQRQPALLPKVAFRWREGAVIHQGNHGVTLPGAPPVVGSGLEVRHFPYRTPEQMVRKSINGAAAYKATDLPPEVGAHWRSYGQLIERYGEQCLHDVFREHFWFLSPSDAGLVYDPAPYLRWQQSAS